MMKKHILLLSFVLGLILAGCVNMPPSEAPQARPASSDLLFHVEIHAGGPLQLESGDQAGQYQTISGIKGEKLGPTDVEIYFKNERIKNDYQTGSIVNWISNMPAGLQARIREARRGSNRVVLMVEGTPQDALIAPIRFNFPASIFEKSQAIRFDSDEAKFEIVQGSLDLTNYPRRPAAARNYLYINGSLGEPLNNIVDLRVNLIDVALREEITEETQVDWIINAPEGLKVTVQPADAGASSLILSVQGTPLEAKNEAVQVVLPGRILGAMSNFPVPNELIQWRIFGGTVNDVLINGSVDSAIIAKDIKISLMGAEFSVNMAPGTNIDWIINIPAGLSARVRRVRANENTAIITVAGTPLVISSDALKISVPVDAVNHDTAVPVRANADARFAINDNTRRVTASEIAGGTSNPNWLGLQRGPLNVPILPAIKDFQGIGLVTVKAVSVERLGADNQYHWTGETVNYGMLIEAAQRLGAHGIINVIVDYTDNIESSETIRELADEHEWSEDQLDKISRGILTEISKDGVRYSIETSHVITRTYIGSALAIKYIDGLNFYEAEGLRAYLPRE